ncbi:putative phage-associated protein [Chitinophaga japonensis]|uniref:Putative phage-associated protein n=2 Tax=Chitinophaga japonensis TaxID=104662 RepID=A0A562TDL3_CHIJA|nr:putative phage-associated protein [Chitinophaga japonensis]
MTKTKLLKLIYIIEELSVRKYGVPFFDLKFDVWKLGPVSRDLFVELSSEPVLLAEYIIREEATDTTVIKPKQQFSDDEFNDTEIKLLEEIAEKFRHSSANDLVLFTHRKHSPWYLTAQRNGLLEYFESGQMNATDVEIDLSQLLEDQPEKLLFYKDHKEFIQQSKRLKS